MVSELVLLRPASVPTDDGFYVQVGKVRKKDSFISDLRDFVNRCFSFPHPQVIVGEDGDVVITGLYEGIPDGADYNHETFDHILDLVGWIEGCVELPTGSEIFAPKVPEQMPMDEPLVVQIGSTLKPDGEHVQTEAKIEHILMKKSSYFDAHQVLDELPEPQEHMKQVILKIVETGASFDPGGKQSIVVNELLQPVAHQLIDEMSKRKNCLEPELRVEMVINELSKPQQQGKLADLKTLLVLMITGEFAFYPGIVYDKEWARRVAFAHDPGGGLYTSETGLRTSHFISDKENVASYLVLVYFSTEIETHLFGSIICSVKFCFDQGGAWHTTSEVALSIKLLASKEACFDPGGTCLRFFEEEYLRTYANFDEVVFDPGILLCLIDFTKLLCKMCLNMEVEFAADSDNEHDEITDSGKLNCLSKLLSGVNFIRARTIVCFAVCCLVDKNLLSDSQAAFVKCLIRLLSTVCYVFKGSLVVRSDGALDFGTSQGKDMMLSFDPGGVCEHHNFEKMPDSALAKEIRFIQDPLIYSGDSWLIEKSSEIRCLFWAAIFAPGVNQFSSLAPNHSHAKVNFIPQKLLLAEVACLSSNFVHEDKLGILIASTICLLKLGIPPIDFHFGWNTEVKTENGEFIASTIYSKWLLAKVLKEGRLGILTSLYSMTVLDIFSTEKGSLSVLVFDPGISLQEVWEIDTEIVPIFCVSVTSKDGAEFDDVNDDVEGLLWFACQKPDILELVPVHGSIVYGKVVGDQLMLGVEKISAFHWLQTGFIISAFHDLSVQLTAASSTLVRHEREESDCSRLTKASTPYSLSTSPMLSKI